MKRKSIKRKARPRKNIVNSIAVVLIMLAFVGIIAYQIHNLKAENAELSSKEQKLQESYETESERTSDLEEQRVYVQTKE